MRTCTYMNIKGQYHSLTLVQGHSDSTYSNFFSLGTERPIESKFHMELSWDVERGAGGGGANIYSNGPGHMTNMAAMPIYSEKLKTSSSLEPKCR